MVGAMFDGYGASVSVLKRQLGLDCWNDISFGLERSLAVCVWL